MFTLHFSLLSLYVCMQTLYNMKGHIVGHLFSALAFAEALTSAAFITWVHACLWPPTYIYLILPSGSMFFVILVTVVSLMMFCIVAKWYKKEMNELLQEQ